MTSDQSAVVARIFGGLGNQMFQYACGQALATRLDRRLEIDARQSPYEPASHNGFELARVFKLDVDHVDEQTLDRLLGWRASWLTRRVLRRLKRRALCGPYIPELQFHYWRGIERIQGTCYLDGYWQSPRYFECIAPQIADKFAFRKPLEGSNAEVAGKIEASAHAVSLHVRRGDYVTNRRASSHHGTASLDYYRSAVRVVRERLGADPSFFVFSDDIAWASKNLELPPNAVFVDQNYGSDSHLDMQLMSLCPNNIIANSSFSWWAAWLNPNPRKIVISPRQWVLVDYDVSTLFPSSWIRL